MTAAWASTPLTVRRRFAAIELGVRAEDEVGERDGVDAEVEQRAAGSRAARAGRAVGVEVLPVVGEDRDELAE